MDEMQAPAGPVRPPSRHRNRRDQQRPRDCHNLFNATPVGDCMRATIVASERECLPPTPHLVRAGAQPGTESVAAECCIRRVGAVSTRAPARRPKQASRAPERRHSRVAQCGSRQYSSLPLRLVVGDVGRSHEHARQARFASNTTRREQSTHGAAVPRSHPCSQRAIGGLSTATRSEPPRPAVGHRRPSSLAPILIPVPARATR